MSSLQIRPPVLNFPPNCQILHAAHRELLAAHKDISHPRPLWRSLLTESQRTSQEPTAAEQIAEGQPVAIPIPPNTSWGGIMGP